MVYDATGRQTLSERYYSDLVLSNNVPARILHADGVIELSSTFQPTYYYHLKDHLGNVRAVVTPGTNNTTVVNQTNEYYPFGMSYTKSVNSLLNPVPNKYKYNGKEEQEMPGKWLDYGARYYDAQIGRFTTVDPAAALYYAYSPYHYGGNSPVNTIDIGGKLFIYVNGFMVDHWWAGQQPEQTFSSSGTINNPNYSKYAPDRNFYSDGPRNAGKSFENDYWHGIQGEFSKIFRDENMLFTNGSFTPSSSGSERFGEGYKNAQTLIEMLENGDVELTEGETIKIMGHSQGAAYAAGLATALLENPKYKHLVEFIVYLAPDQPNQFKHPNDVPGYQFSTESDLVSSTGPIAWLRNSKYSQIDGASWAEQRKYYNGSLGGHYTDSWVSNVVQWALSYGIPITVYE
jgi:RHS repeat-associated protein